MRINPTAMAAHSAGPTHWALYTSGNAANQFRDAVSVRTIVMAMSAAEAAKLRRQGKRAVKEGNRNFRILVDSVPWNLTLKENRPGSESIADLACILEPEDINEKVKSAKALYLEDEGPKAVECKQPTYNTSKGHHSFGRFYAQQPSLQSVSKKVRSLASGGELVEMDFSASHQTLACELFTGDNDLKPIREYVHDKAKCLDVVAQWAGCDEEEAKEKFFQRLSFGGSLEEACKEVEGEKGTSIGRNYPTILKLFAQSAAKLPRKLKGKFPEAFGFALSISEEVKEKPEALKWASAMGLFLQHVEAEVAWLAIATLPERGIEVSALIHDGLLLRREDADAINIDEFAAELRERLGFRWLTLKWKPLEVTQEVMAWRDDLISRHSRLEPPAALRVAERIRLVLNKRTKLVLNASDIARAILPELQGDCLYSRGYWILSCDGILFLYPSLQAAKMEALNGMYRDLIEPAMTYLMQQDRKQLQENLTAWYKIENKLKLASGEEQEKPLKNAQAELGKEIEKLRSKLVYFIQIVPESRSFQNATSAARTHCRQEYRSWPHWYLAVRDKPRFEIQLRPGAPNGS